MDAEHLIRTLGLQPLPEEGGYYRETYRSAETLEPAALPARYRARKPFGSAIYFLLSDEAGCFSALHRLPTDEVYHFYLGDPVELLLLFPDGSGRVVRLGQDLERGEQVQGLAPQGVWQGSRLVPGGRYALLGTTMAPGFGFEDYEGGVRAELLAAYPEHADRIRSLTR
jgi:uncharacterized protein